MARPTDIEARIGRTKVEVTRLGFGAAAMAGLYRAVPEARALASVRAAYDAGVRYFDTAPHYGFGQSESRLGAALRELDPDEKTIVSTKVGRLLVPIDADPNDARAKIVRMTAKGRRARDAAVAVITPRLLALLEQIGAAEFEHALPFLTKLRQVLDAARE